ncbi:TPA: hypothetical protein ACH7EL_005007, partial [Escherichia coli]
CGFSSARDWIFQVFGLCVVTKVALFGAHRLRWEVLVLVHKRFRDKDFPAAKQRRGLNEGGKIILQVCCFLIAASLSSLFADLCE